jgi:hypothetical protein
MSSLSRLGDKKKKTQTGEILIPHSEDYDDMELADRVDDIDLKPEDKFNHCVFISDTDINAKIRNQLIEHGKIKNFKEKLMANRSFQTLLTEFDITHLWINIQSKSARAWLGTYLPKNDGTYCVVAAISGNKNDKWIANIKDYVDVTCKIKHLNKIRSLSFPDLADKMGDIFINAPSNPIAACFGVSNKLTKCQKND